MIFSSHLISFVALALSLSPKPAIAAACNWCVFGNAGVTFDVLRLAKLPPRKLLKEIRGRSVCVKIMDTGRRPSKGAFGWGQLEKATLRGSDVSQLSGLMGKMLCKQELAISEKCPTIVLAADAPFSRLIHEYLHYVQASRDGNWCPLARQLWVRGQNERDWRAIRDKEWDTSLFLWNNRERMGLSLDDKIAIINEAINEATQRKRIDPDGERFLVEEKPAEALRKLVESKK